MSRDGTDPALQEVAVPLEGDGAEMLGMVIDGRYHLEATLGRGGMGLVFRAAHVGLRRQVAVKILHPSLAASSDVRNRFEREALAVGKIDHPNCVSVYDVGRLPDGSLYLAMELLDGRPLSDILEQEGQIAPGRALHILAHVLRGLSHIHSAGLIHRDIKPENIFLIRHGQDEDFAKILDFGIAKGMSKTDLDDGVKLTQAGMAFGTPIYMAPEQALGNPMDGRADLYAAAVLGYEMLCGQPPFYSEDKLEVMSMHTAKPVPPMRQRLIKGARPVPSSIERLIVRGLTKKPSERYANADVFVAAVEAALTTPDGGVTDVVFARRPERTTGSQPLVTDDGELRITEETEGGEFIKGDGPNDSIASAIESALASAPPSKPGSAGPPGLSPAIGGPPAAPAKPPGTPARGAQAPRLPGGIGIGLPYTGPRGEPIFGLTPEQRLARLGPDASIASALEPEPVAAPGLFEPVKPRRPRWPYYTAGAMIAIAIGMFIAVATLPGGDDADDAPPKPAYVVEADERLDGRGDPDGALAILDRNKPDSTGNADAQLTYGHAYAARRDTRRALEAYAQAMNLRPGLNDGKLYASLRALAADRDLDVVKAAFDLWLRTNNPLARHAVLITGVSQNLARRRAALEVIERHKLGDLVEWWLVFAYDLQEEPTCAKRKQVVAKMRAFGDPRVVPALERAAPPRMRPGDVRRHPNACLYEDAQAAIRYLNGLRSK